MGRPATSRPVTSVPDDERRDVEGAKAKQKRDSRPLNPIAIPVEVHDDVTERYLEMVAHAKMVDPDFEPTPEFLAQMRSKRPTKEAIAKLEVRADRLDAALSEIKGEMNVWPKLVQELRERSAMTHTADLKAKATAQEAEIEAARKRREWITRIIAGLFALATAYFVGAK